ncbi:CoA pyrophosphatase [Acetobacterium sp.]|uniref:NUDIX hydrolase n=1 Tax=Acetobacterium sp. TaxID=1872094 RepID=UPI000CB94FC3|nr:CoA pyrophosphatase [Acetobacterium sp.]MDO9493376.1 CoA pyrophosphatase [Acetobacterium sp.]PKM70906.1 MAG: CoA pyrophosphatase [Firmicutes bacterium HGW-Firmicutes-17]
MEREEFFNRRPGIIGERNFSQYAVLVVLVETAEGPAFIFEKRAETLNRQPGEICFPGGRLEAGETPLEAAIRETIEELLVDRQQIEILGPGDVFISPFNMMIYPFIAILQDYRYGFSEEEVGDVFTVPVRFFQEHVPKKYLNHLSHEQPNDFPYECIPGGKNYPWVKGTYETNFYTYQGDVIWGMTACIIESTVELIQDYHLLNGM